MLRTTASMLLAGMLLVSLGQSVGCESVGGVVGGGGGSSLQEAASAVLGDWTLAGINGGDVAGLAAEKRPTLIAVEDGTVGGFAGVNRWSSTLDLDGLAAGRFDLGPTAATKMAGPPEETRLERRFLAALGGVTGFDAGALSDGVLRLLGSDGAELLRFVRGG